MMRVACAALVVVLGQDFDKSKHNWAKFKVGSFAKFKMTIEAAGNKLEGNFRQELAELKEQEYVLKTSSEMAGGSQEATETESFPVKEGEETIEVEGQKQACVIWKSKGKRDDKATETRVWIPKGQSVPFKLSSKGPDETFEFVAVKLKDEVTAVGKKFDCVKLEGVLENQMGKLKGTMWLTPDVPSGAVRMALENAEGGVKVWFELSEFEAKK